MEGPQNLEEVRGGAINKHVFHVITKNLKWEILIKNLVTFKRWDVVKYENF